MPPPTPLTPADRFARVIDGLRRAVAARGGRMGLAAPLILLIWARLRRMAVRFARLDAKLRAGTLPAPRRRPASPRPGRPPSPRLPQGFAWLVRLVPESAAYGSQLQHLLAEPEMAALIVAVPQTGRILRPLCRMLGVRPRPGLLTPPATPRTAPSRPAIGRVPPATSPQVPPPPREPRTVPRACGPPVQA